MIYDAENMFMTKKDLSGGTDSDVIYNGGGSAYNALWLYVLVDQELGGDATISLKTSDNEDMSGAVELTALKITKAEGSTAAVRLPQGGLKYFQISVGETLGEGASASGVMTAGLVLDTDLA